jgi:hypothetical protein
MPMRENTHVVNLTTGWPLNVVSDFARYFAAGGRPSDRPFAEVRAADPEGNFFDISQHGFEMVETDADRSKKEKVPA